MYMGMGACKNRENNESNMEAAIIVEVSSRYVVLYKT